MPEPTTLVLAAISIGTTLAGALVKPPKPSSPKPLPSQSVPEQEGALAAARESERRRRRLALGRRGTISGAGSGLLTGSGGAGPSARPGEGVVHP